MITMDVLSMTNKYRENLLKFFKPILDDRSYIWVRGIISDINHKIISGDNEYIAGHAMVMYRNIIPFLKDYCDEITPAVVLYLFYSCAIQLGIRKLGDEVEELPEFQDGMDMEDWQEVTNTDLWKFDVYGAQTILERNLKGESVGNIWSGGLYSLHTLDFL